MTDTIANVVMVIITLGGFIITIIALRKDNRKSNAETIEKIIEKTISDVEERKDFERRLALLEQKVQFQDDGTRKELKELKDIITKWASKFDKHIETHTK